MPNKYVLPDIVSRSAMDARGLKLLHEQYDNFFKIASGLDIADMADGNVESTVGWFAVIDMRLETEAVGDTPSESGYQSILNSVLEVDSFLHEEIPAAGVYYTVTLDSGVIFAYECENIAVAHNLFNESQIEFAEWDKEENGSDEPEPGDYVWIAAWGEMMRSNTAYILVEQNIAAKHHAPLTAIFRNPPYANVRADQWETLETIKSDSTRNWMQEYAHQHELLIPDEVIAAWSK